MTTRLPRALRAAGRIVVAATAAAGVAFGGLVFALLLLGNGLVVPAVATLAAFTAGYVVVRSGLLARVDRSPRTVGPCSAHPAAFDRPTMTLPLPTVPVRGYVAPISFVSTSGVA